MNSDQKIIDTIEQKIQAAQSDDSKSIGKSLKKYIEEDSGVIDEYIDRRIEQLGDKIRKEVSGNMENFRQEIKQTSVYMLIYSAVTWLAIISAGIFYYVRNSL